VVSFVEFLTPFTLGGCNFPIFNLFLTIVGVLDPPRGGVQVLFELALDNFLTFLIIIGSKY
jgi:hypothetical protein